MTKVIIALALAGAATGAAFIATGARPVVAATTAVAAAAPAPRSGADAAHPVVLELFQSQGCSSCPPANLVLNDIANRPDVLALNFAVTYWDQLGWKDIYGQQKFTDRQWEYSTAQGRHNVQTPQLIVNGRAAVLGSFKPEVERAIAANSRGTSGPSITARGTMVDIGANPGSKPATVWLVDYDPRTVAVPIRAGENGGRTLPHRDIVKRLTPLGTWTGAAAHYTRLAPVSGAQAILVQVGKGGTIVAAAKI
jgi:hypothetical protein